jgi:hypothetical protein
MSEYLQIAIDSPRVIIFYLTADGRRRSQTFLPVDSRDFASLARDQPAGKNHVNRFAIKKTGFFTLSQILSNIDTNYCLN